MSTTSAAPGEIRVTIRGEIDLLTATDLRPRLLDTPIHPSCATVILDLRAVTFMGAIGIAMLAELTSQAADRGAHVLVVATTAPVLRLFQITGSDHTIHSSVTAARAAERGDVRG